MGRAADKALQFVGSLLVVVLGALLWGGGASQMETRAAGFQSGTPTRPTSAQAAGSGAATESAEVDALRKRAQDFYGLMQLARWDQAEGFISADTRENFHKAQKSPFLGFNVGSVEVAPGGVDATVEVTMQIVTSNVAAPGPINVPQKSRWRRVDGVWYMIVPPPENSGAQLGNLFGKGAPKSQVAPRAEDLKFKGHRYILGKIGSDQLQTARFPFTNVTDHVVTLSSVVTGCDCLEVKTTQKEFKPGESGELDVQFNPKGFEREYMQTIVVKTDPGGVTSHLTVGAYVLGPELHMVPREGQVRRKGPAGSKPTSSAAPGGAQ
ncbi:MAG TPA: DUF1573 domain-containing protein [Terriglobia bacterium]|nr:DUF1573 domain-containing protein [Terriglobia bacterium]